VLRKSVANGSEESFRAYTQDCEFCGGEATGKFFYSDRDSNSCRQCYEKAVAKGSMELFEAFESPAKQKKLCDPSDEDEAEVSTPYWTVGGWDDCLILFQGRLVALALDSAVAKDIVVTMNGRSSRHDRSSTRRS